MKSVWFIIVQDIIKWYVASSRQFPEEYEVKNQGLS